MTPPAALLLHDVDKDCRQLRSLIAGVGCTVEEALLNGPSASTPAGSYCLVLFVIKRHTAQIVDLIRDWHDGAPGTPLLGLGNRVARRSSIAMFEAGLDAYLTEPVGFPELRARIRAAMRRGQPRGARVLQLFREGPTIDLDARIVNSAGGSMALTPTEFRILEQLTLHMNQTVPSEELVGALWAGDQRKGVHSLRFFIKNLRHKLEPDPAHPRYLVTEAAVGYRLQIPAEASEQN